MITKPVQFNLILLKIWRNNNQNVLFFLQGLSLVFLITATFLSNVCKVDVQKQFKVVLSGFMINHFKQTQGWSPPGSVN